MRLLLVCGAIVALFIVSYLIWGDYFNELLDSDRTKEWFLSFDPWTWAVAILLMIIDVALPIPATAVLATLGLIYGPVIGGLIGCVGTFLAGTTAYLSCRVLGERAVLFLLGPKTLERSRRFFTTSGGWLVALSRWMILLPEIVSCLAGLTRMPPRRYFASLACGTVPMSFAYATIGYYNFDKPFLALAVSAAVPVFLWWPVSRWMRRRSANAGAAEAEDYNKA